jgi:dihydrofolate reductase
MNYVYIAQSLDGFIATDDGGIEWLEAIPNPEGSDFGFSEFISKVDALLMGRNTFEKVLSFGAWPYAIPVYVLSNTLAAVPDEVTGKAFLINGSLEEVLFRLSKKGIQDLYIDGGKVITSFLKEDLIDEMIITTVPVLLGRGLPLFGDTGEMKAFSHSGTEVLNDYLVKSHFVRNRNIS